MEFPFENKINTLAQTKIIAKDFSKELSTGNIILLNGNLGTGKTTFIKFACEHFGINNVNSPSFSIVNEYYGKIKVFHFDFYRLKSSRELFDIGFDEYLNDEEAVVFIEWAELFKDVIPKKYYEININFLNENERFIRINNNYD